MATIEGIVEKITPKQVTVTDLNEKLLEKLYFLIEQANSAEEILPLTEAVAKYNTSVRNNAVLEREDTPSEIDTTLGEIIGG
nr:MAG TPA: hypothetical protein [Caudoviricetes sp.]